MTGSLRALFLVLLAVLALGVAPAGAQDSSTPSNYPPSNGVGVLDFGVQRQGATFNKEDCGFAPGSTAQVALNGQSTSTKAAESDGCVRLTVEVVDRDTIRIDGTAHEARPCAVNTITVSGSHRNGGTLSFDNRFRIDCAAGTGAAALPRTGASSVGDLSVGGAGLVVVGVVLAIVARRRRSSGRDALAEG